MTMSSDELDATTDVVTLAKTADGLGTNVARRLEDHGIETVADILIAEEGALTDVPYVSDLRADTLREVADEIVDDEPAPEPRDVDLEATESVVSEAAIPLSVRRGKAVLIGGPRSEVYHTDDCSAVRSHELDSTVSEDTAVKKGLAECPVCREPDTNAYGSGSSHDSDLEPLVDPIEVVLEATLGEKLQITLAERDGWAKPWTVTEAPEPTEWESAADGTWNTRRLRLSESASGTAKEAREFDLVLAGDEIRVEEPPVKRASAQPDAPGWGVESVGAVGRVSTSSLVQLQADEEQKDAKPEGDDTWRQYHDRGETA